MLSFDRDALLCDMAETYGIYDIKAFKPKQIAMYACGLHPDSRIRSKLDGIYPMNTMEVLAHIADELKIIRHYFTAEKSDPMPTFFTELIHEDEKRSKKNAQGFQSGEAFDEAWKQLAEGGDNNA